jgi:4-coumarate--CoA ligase
LVLWFLFPTSKTDNKRKPVHQFQIAMPSIIFVHSDCLASVREAAAVVGFQLHRMVIINSDGTSGSTGFRKLGDLINETPPFHQFTERLLARGEAKTTIAFLAPSSGTTGAQKVSVLQT